MSASPDLWCDMCQSWRYTAPCGRDDCPVQIKTESLSVMHARKQGAADGFQEGWHSALNRVGEGDAIQTLRELVPNSMVADLIERIELAEREAVMWRTEAGRRGERLGALRANIRSANEQLDELRDAIAPYRHTPEDRELWADPRSFVSRVRDLRESQHSVEIALRLAREATNGWACYAKRKIELDEIARLHQAIDAL